MATDVNLWGVLLGAGIASVVPLVTLYQSGKRWKIEKRLENLRLKHSRLEDLYREVLEKLPPAIDVGSYPTTLVTKIEVHGSPDVQRHFRTFIELGAALKAAGGRLEPDQCKFAFMDIATAAQRHLAAVEKEIEQTLA